MYRVRTSKFWKSEKLANASGYVPDNSKGSETISVAHPRPDCEVVIASSGVSSGWGQDFRLCVPAAYWTDAALRLMARGFPRSDTVFMNPPEASIWLCRLSTTQ